MAPAESADPTYENDGNEDQFGNDDGLYYVNDEDLLQQPQNVEDILPMEDAEFTEQNGYRLLHRLTDSIQGTVFVAESLHHSQSIATATETETEAGTEEAFLVAIKRT